MLKSHYIILFFTFLHPERKLQSFLKNYMRLERNSRFKIITVLLLLHFRKTHVFDAQRFNTESLLLCLYKTLNH